MSQSYLHGAPPSYENVIRDLPPNYEEAVHLPVLPSGIHHLSTTCHYTDFIPESPYISFRDLVDRINNWLALFPKLRLKACETVNFLLDKSNHVPRPDLSATFIPANGHKQYVIGIRCWVICLPEAQGAPQKLGYITKLPPKKKECILSYVVTSCLEDTSSVDVTYPEKHTSIAECVDALNEDLKSDPLPGTILTVESRTAVVRGDWRSDFSNLTVEPDKLFYTEDDNGLMNNYFDYIRLFYIAGPPQHEVLAWKDFHSDIQANPANLRKPKFESFASLMHKTSHWAYQQRDVRIVKIQTLEAKVESFIQPSAAGRFQYNASAFTPFANISLLKFLRIFYVRKETGIDEAEVKLPYHLSQRTFTPYRIGIREFESPRDNISRMQRWMHHNSTASGLNDDDIVCVETVNYDQYLSRNGMPDIDSLSSDRMYRSGRAAVHTIRLYLNGVCSEPPIDILGYPPIINVQEDVNCTVL